MRLAFAATLLLGVSACAEPIDRTADDEAVVPPPAEMTPAASQTMLVPGVIDEGLRRDRDMMGELGCVFRRGNETLFVASANSVSLDSAQGLVVIDGEPRTLDIDGEGGYNSLQGAASFSGADGLEIEIAAGEPAQIEDNEEALTGPEPMQATMTLRQGGRSVNVEGIYECGPQGTEET